MIATVLRSAGHPVATARDGLDALEVLRTAGRPDLVLLDMMMPRLDGESLLAIVSKDPVLCSIPFVVMSAVARSERAARAHGCEFVAKPIDFDRLLDVAQRYARSQDRDELRDETTAA